MDIPNLSKYLIYEDGRIYGKNRGMMLDGSINKQGFRVYGLSFDDDYYKYINIKQLTLVQLYKNEKIRREKCSAVLNGSDI